MKILPLIFIALCLTAQAATISIADYGALGDLTNTTCNVSSGSTNASLGATLSPGDVGKLLIVFGAGTATSGGNHQDYIGTILSVSGTNCTLSTAAGNSITNSYCQIGTQNVTAFQNAIAALSTTNDTINIPAGNYLVVPPFMLTNGVMISATDVHGSIYLSRGGITFQGIGTPTLTGCGAWLKLGSYCHRGAIIATPGPVTNNYQLVFDGIVFDGGVTNGLTSNSTFPASAVDGSGWDLTHTAFVNLTATPVHTNLLFSNCTFQHWRGEMVKSGIVDTNAWVTVTNCVWSDGNASGFNLGMSHDINGCRFISMLMSMEFGQGFYNQPSFFRNSVVTNTLSGMVFNGAVTNHASPLYTVSGNVINGTNFGILCSPGNNLLITSNTITSSHGIEPTNVGVQGNAPNANWTVSYNIFTNTFICMNNAAATASMPLTNALFYGNTAYSATFFASGYGYNSGVHFSSNVMSGSTLSLDSRTILGEMFIDDMNNVFPAYLNSDGGSHTNTISYQRGGHQTAFTSVTNSVFRIDDTATTIPNGVTMIITNTASKAALFQMSNQTFQPARYIPAGGVLKLYRDNGLWKDSSISYLGNVSTGQVR